MGRGEGLRRPDPIEKKSKVYVRDRYLSLPPRSRASSRNTHLGKLNGKKRHKGISKSYIDPCAHALSPYPACIYTAGRRGGRVKGRSRKGKDGLKIHY